MDDIKKQLTRMESKQDQLLESATQQKPILSFAEACKYLDMSSSYLYKLTSSNRIPYSKPMGKKIFFDRNDLNSWMMRNRKSSADEINQKAASIVTLGQTKKKSSNG